MRSTNGGNISAKVSWDRKKAEVAAGLRLTQPLGSKARFNSHRKPMPRVLSVRRRAAWGGRGKGCPKQGISVARQDPPARQETRLPATPELAPILQLASISLP